MLRVGRGNRFFIFLLACNVLFQFELSFDVHLIIYEDIRYIDNG